MGLPRSKQRAQDLGVVNVDPWIASDRPAAKVRILERRPLAYRAPPDPGWDIGSHVRAASSLQRVRTGVIDELWIVSDDTRALARGRPDDLRPVLLPADVGGVRRFGEDRGNKARKLDLEASFMRVDGPRARLFSLGSGSTPRRQQIVSIAWSIAGLDVTTQDVRIVDAAPLYRMLRAETDFSGSELNLEGCVCVGDRLWLFQRGNGAARGILSPIDAIGVLELHAFLDFVDGSAAVPALLDVHRVDLGSVAGVRLGFTDACAMPGGRVFYVAAAEGSPNAVDDGPVVGCALGWTVGPPEAGVLHQTLIIDEAGEVTTSKIEGIAEGDVDGELWAVVDTDDVDRPAELLRLGVDLG